MFSCRDAETRTRWLRLLREQITVSAATPIPTTPAQAAANAVAVQVLRDAVLTPDEPGPLTAGTPSPRPNVVAPRFGRPVTPSTPRGRLGTPTRPPTAARSNSISRLYPVLYRQEAESGEKRPTAATATATSGMLTPAAPGGGKPSTGNNSPDPSTSELSAARLSHGDFVKSGHELVVTTEQNSLLPLVLTFLNAGLEVSFLLPVPASDGLGSTDHISRCRPRRTRSPCEDQRSSFRPSTELPHLCHLSFRNLNILSHYVRIHLPSLLIFLSYRYIVPALFRGRIDCVQFSFMSCIFERLPNLQALAPHQPLGRLVDE